MPTNFKLLKSEFITTDYPIDTKYIHWSRIYEWKYVIDAINHYKPIDIHNTACGGLNTGDCLHLTFCKDLSTQFNNVLNSDLWGGGYIGTENKPDGDNFIYYDITKPYSGEFDLVLNISTLEHLPPSNIINSLDNLLNQVKIGGHLILTFDYPIVDLALINKYFNVNIIKPTNSITNGNLSIILIHLIKI